MSLHPAAILLQKRTYTSVHEEHLDGALAILEEIASYRLDERREALQQIFMEMNRSQQLSLVATLGNYGSISSSEYKRARPQLRSFYPADWNQVAGQYGLPHIWSAVGMEWGLGRQRPALPLCYLPPSIHQEIFQVAWRAMDAYGEVGDHHSEVATMRVLEPFITIPLSLFRGHVYDEPDESLVETTSHSGFVEHKIYTTGCCIMVVLQRQLEKVAQSDLFAQLFLEMIAAAQINSTSPYKNYRVYGMLTDFNEFHFFSYNPLSGRFEFEGTIEIPVGVAREEILSRSMIPITNKIFSIFYDGYIMGLEALRDEFSPLATSGKNIPYARIEYARVLGLAKNARKALAKPPKGAEALEAHASCALEEFHKSLDLMPREMRLRTEAREPCTVQELRVLAQKSVKAACE